METLADQFQSGLALSRASDALAQQRSIVGKDAAALAGPGNGNVELLAMDGGG